MKTLRRNNKKLIQRFLILALPLAFLLTAMANEAWPNWRGPNFNGSITTG